MNNTTSWNKVADWYGDIVGEKGHYYHQSVILPNVVRLLEVKRTDKVLDVACGNGVLARVLPECEYVGVDIAENLVKEAKQNVKKNQSFFVGDVTKKIPVNTRDFDKAAVILALQNIEKPTEMLKNVSSLLKKNGQLVMVLNHPAFRIPQSSSWGWDEKNRVQYRRIDSYLSSKKIAIVAHPGEKVSENTVSFHYSIQDISKFLNNSGFVIEKMEEWVSPKKSEGGRAMAEDTARREFPLFMCIIATKK